MKKIIDLIISYKLSIFIIIFYEILYIILGYKGNSFNIRKNLQSTDTIPCSYYFLHKIYDIIKKENIKSLIDLKETGSIYTNQIQHKFTFFGKFGNKTYYGLIFIYIFLLFSIRRLDHE